MGSHSQEAWVSRRGSERQKGGLMSYLFKFKSLILAVVCLGAISACDPGTEGQGQCDASTCEQVPESKCAGAVAISYEPTSLCDAQGQCLFNEVRLNCAASDRTCVGGACLSNEEALCVDVVCESPPANTCNGNTAVVYESTGTCNENGFCSYDFTETLCADGEICSEGVCVVDDGSDPCLGVVCDAPPSDTCNGNNTVTYTATGACVEGECVYESTETACEENTSCSNGVCLENSDPCAGVNCVEPPANACFGNTAITYPDVGVCNSGVCSYPSTETECVEMTTCVEGVCVPDADPCDGVECNTPPADICDGNSVVSYAETGTCDEGLCAYEVTTTVPCGTDEACSNGVCVANTDPCAEVDCNTPPADTCDENTAITYPEVGVCSDGNCTYSPTETPCATTETCVTGMCMAVDPCEGQTCETPPADFCDGNSAVTYGATGTCSNGDCIYTSATEACGTSAFCESGICVPITETKVVINEIYYNPPTSQGDDLDYEFLELYNAGQTINLENWTFTSGIVHTFDDFTFENGTFLVLVNRPESYENLPATVIEWNGSNLKNDEETLTLTDGTGAIMDTVTYDVRAAAGWPTAANGGGKSLELGHPSSDNAVPENWHASDAMHGSPGVANSSP